MLQLANTEAASMRELSDLICSDPAFSSEVLTIASSPLYPRRVPVTTILQAIAVLGTQTLKGLCLTIGVRAYLGASLQQDSLRAIWRHGLAVALIAEQLAFAGLQDKDAAYTAGIMHDVGRLVLAILQPKAYAALLQSHLIDDWQLPREFEPIVAHHHSLKDRGQSWSMADLINVSCRMADAVGFAVFPGCKAMLYSDLLQELPTRERGMFCPDAESLAFQVGSKINALESI
ncbi:HDIG domain protein [Acidisarcina polymorpha]|uniref:HDIG domain protein n=1 Tax=Acidisarcina polymorpha TaxID=2211140 RepID=A0A2Z5FWN1_9BACT|nr:HDIG domain protein [Acidisarcina polymorpha]